MKLLTVNIQGLNWYVTTRATTVNATLEDVNENNFQTVSDIDCFTMQKTINTVKELEVEVMEVMANNALNDFVYTGLECINNTSFKTSAIISKIEDQTLGYREMHVLVYYDHCYIDGNLLTIVSNDNKSIDVALISSRLGEIVG